MGIPTVFFPFVLLHMMVVVLLDYPLLDMVVGLHAGVVMAQDDLASDLEVDLVDNLFDKLVVVLAVLDYVVHQRLLVQMGQQ